MLNNEEIRRLIQSQIYKNIRDCTVSTNAKAGDIIFVSFPSGEKLNCYCIQDIVAGEAIALHCNDGNWYVIGSKIPEPNASQFRLITYRRTKNIDIKKKYKVKTLLVFYETNATNLGIGGYKKDKKLLELPQNYREFFINNLGVSQYLATLQYIKDGLRNYIFNEYNKEQINVANDITTGYEYYLSNGLWETTSTTPERNVIVNGGKRKYPISIVVGSTVAQHGNYFAYPTINTSVKTWLPGEENRDGELDFTRTRDSVVYEQPPTQPINIRNPNGFIIDARYGTLQLFRYLNSADLNSDAYYQQYSTGDKIGDPSSVQVAQGEYAHLASIITVDYTTTFSYTKNSNNEIRLQVENKLNSITEQLYVSRLVQIIKAPDIGMTFYLNQWSSGGSRNLSSNYSNSFFNARNYNYTLDIPIMRSHSWIQGTKTSNGQITNISEGISYNSVGVSIAQRIYKGSPYYNYQQVSYNDFAPATSNSTPAYRINIGDFEVNANGQQSSKRYLPISFPGIEGAGSGRVPLEVTTTSNITVRRAFVPYSQEPPLPPPIIIKEERYTERLKGNFLALKTVNGYIRQEFEITKKINISRSYILSLTTTTDISITNNTSNLIYTRIKNDEKQNTLLNLSNFMVINYWNFITDINLESTIFELTIGSSGDIINSIRSLIGTKYLFNLIIDDVPHLIEGVIVNIRSSYYDSTLSCSITKLTPNIKTSFLNIFITNNGSFYNYLFRKRHDYELITKELFIEDTGTRNPTSYIPPLVFNPIINTDGLFIASNLYKYVYDNTISEVIKQDNVVDNKIYSVVDVNDTVATVEQWDIDNSGKVMFGKIFKTPYYPIQDKYVDMLEDPSTRHSFHPKPYNY
jgi:hypothetical protein